MPAILAWSATIAINLPWFALFCCSIATYYLPHFVIWAQTRSLHRRNKYPAPTICNTSFPNYRFDDVVLAPQWSWNLVSAASARQSFARLLVKRTPATAYKNLDWGDIQFVVLSLLRIACTFR